MENELNAKLVEIFESVERSLSRKNAQVRRAVDRTRLMIADILAKYTGSDGKIPRNRINAVLKDLSSIDGEIYRSLRTELSSVLEDVSDTSTVGVAEAVLAVVGVAALIEALNLPVTLAELTVGIAEALFSALTGSTYRKYKESAILSAFNRVGEDGLILNDRLKRLSHQLRKEIETTLRQSIRNGEGTAEILRKIDRKYTELDWRLDTIVESESLFVMRQVNAKFAEESGLVKALRIVDFPHGSPGEHARHKCAIYANSNEHGLGDGVYPIGTRKIRNPHPRCRSILLFVLVDGIT